MVPVPYNDKIYSDAFLKKVEIIQLILNTKFKQICHILIK